MFGSQEILIIALIVFILFGASAIPKFARGIGQAKKEFEDGIKAAKSTDNPEQKPLSKPKTSTSKKTVSSSTKKTPRKSTGTTKKPSAKKTPATKKTSTARKTGSKTKSSSSSS